MSERTGATAARLQLAARASELRAQGLLQREIAAALAISRSYASSLLDDPDGSRARARKDRYCGTCLDCGSPTNGGDGREHAPTRCATCDLAYRQTEAYRLAAQKWPADLLLARIREWAALYGEPPAVPDWNPWTARAMHDEARARRWENADGYWPWFSLVFDRFGTWSAALTTAGFTPRSPNGHGNMHRRRDHGRLQQRAAIVQQLCDTGIPLIDIAHVAYTRWGYKTPRSFYETVGRKQRVRSPRIPTGKRERTPPHLILAALDRLERPTDVSVAA